MDSTVSCIGFIYVQYNYCHVVLWRTTDLCVFWSLVRISSSAASINQSNQSDRNRMTSRFDRFRYDDGGEDELYDGGTFTDININSSSSTNEKNEAANDKQAGSSIAFYSSPSASSSCWGRRFREFSIAILVIAFMVTSSEFSQWLQVSGFVCQSIQQQYTSLFILAFFRIRRDWASRSLTFWSGLEPVGCCSVSCFK